MNLLKQSIKLILGVFVFVLIFNQFVGWAVTEKSWIEKLWITFSAGGGFGVIGTVVGLIVGGIGVAIGGGAIGIAGWLAFGVLGFGAGALGGSIWTIMSNPGAYNYDSFKLSVVVVIALSAAAASVLSATKLGRWIRRYINAGATVPHSASPSDEGVN